MALTAMSLVTLRTAEFIAWRIFSTELQEIRSKNVENKGRNSVTTLSMNPTERISRNASLLDAVLQETPILNFIKIRYTIYWFIQGNYRLPWSHNKVFLSHFVQNA